MKRRRWIALALVTIVVAISLSLLWPRGPRPCRATFEQVREGMSREEVIATVGRPPGVYTDRPVLPFIMCNFGGHSAQEWHADDATLTVIRTADGRAFSVIVTDPLPDDRPLLQRLRSRLGL